MFWLEFADKGLSPEPLSAQYTEPQQQDGDAAQEVHAVLKKILPWALSLLLHVIIVILAVSIPWLIHHQSDEDGFIVPEARLSATPLVPLQTQPMTTRRNAQSRRRTLPTTRSSTASPIDARVESQSKLIGVLGATSGVRSPFGMKIGEGQQFSAGFFGSGGNAEKIVYVVDASGSLIDTLEFVITELKRSINLLVTQQTFSVFFFHGEDVLEVPPKGRMKQANRKNKKRIIEWIDPDSGNITPFGASNPVKAIKQALAYRPDLLFLLSDAITGQGVYEIDQRQLTRAIKRANKHNTKINTIQFLYPDPLEKIGLEATMQMIANENGGVYKFLNARELGIE